MLENVPSLGPFVYVRTMDLGGWYASCYIMICFGVLLVALAVAMYKYLLKLFNGEPLQGTPVGAVAFDVDGEVTTVEIKAGPPYAPQEIVVPKGGSRVRLTVGGGVRVDLRAAPGRKTSRIDGPDVVFLEEGDDKILVRRMGDQPVKKPAPAREKTAVAASKLENSGLPKGVGDNAKAHALWDAQGKDGAGDYFGQSFAKIRGNDMFGRAQDLPYRQQAGGNKKKPAYSTLSMETPPAVAPMVTTDARPARGVESQFEDTALQSSSTCAIS